MFSIVSLNANSNQRHATKNFNLNNTHWSSLVKKLLLIQPSSASAERVFSLLTNAFGSQQESALQDYLEASVMLRYNNAKRV